MIPRLLFFLALALPIFAVDPPASFKFQFGPGKVATGYTQVNPTHFYGAETGFGFEPGERVRAVDRGGGDLLRAGFCTSNRPFYFSVAVPEGNYMVTVLLGDTEAASVTTVKAELRRLMVENAATDAAQFDRRSFIVNIRTPKIPGGHSVKLKDRESASEAWAWDDKLTLEFSGKRPAVASMEITRIDDIPTVFLLGDSTVCDQPAEPYSSWGQMLTRYFRPEVAVANHAESGEAVRSSMNALRFEKVFSRMKPGDYLFMQFGHNDMKAVDTNSYAADLKRCVEETRSHGGIPVLITSMHRRTFGADGIITNSLKGFPDAVRQIAAEEKTALIDLNAMSKIFYEKLGKEGSSVAFKEGDGTHHNNYGSYELAKCIAQGIRDNKLDLAKYIVDDFKGFDPAHPDPIADFQVPASTQFTGEKPLGN